VHKGCIGGFTSCKMGQVLCSLFRVACKPRRSCYHHKFDKWYSNPVYVATKQPKIDPKKPIISWTKEAIARKNERLRDLDNNVPWAA
jgi:hypothetical protein